MSTSVFEVTVEKTGLVRYTGSDRARTEGDQTTRIEPVVAGRILKAVSRAVRESKRPYTPRATVAADIPTLCVSARSLTGQDELNSGREQTRKLIDLVNDTIDPRNWACPTAQSSDASSLNYEYCGAPQVGAQFRDEDSCGLINLLDIYENGAIHFWVAGDPQTPWARALHQFARISRADLQMVLEQVGKYQRTGQLVDDADRPAAVRPSAQRAGMYGRPEDIRAFKDLMSRLAPIRWADGRARGNRCESSIPLPSGLVTLSSPFADGTWSKRYEQRRSE